MTTINNRLSNNYKKNPELLLSKKYPYFVNPFKFDIKNMQILSTSEETGSGSCVFLLKRLDGKKYQYILKVTGIDNNEITFTGLNYPQLESKIYQIINKLVKRKITPHVFTIVGKIPNINRELLQNNHKFKNSFLDRNEFNFCYVMLNETSVRNTDIMKFGDFVDKYNSHLSIFINILFQILYTLESFNRVGIIHSDLHLSNIFVVINKNNILSDDYKKTINIYKFRDANGNFHKIKLENIGFNIRIYDFDRSVKFPKKNTMFKKKIHSEITKSLASFSSYHTKENQYFDTYKVIAHLYNHCKFDNSIVSQIQKLLESFFIEKELLISGIVNNIDYISNKKSEQYLKEGNFRGVKQWRNYFFLNQIPYGLMMKTEDMLIHIKEKYSNYICNNPSNVSISEVYNLENINKVKLTKKKIKK